MTRTISLIIGITVTALGVAVPAALGGGRVAGSVEQVGVAFFRANELATLPQQAIQLHRATDAWDRDAVGAPRASTYLDASERSTLPTSLGNSNYVDANERGTFPANPVEISATSSRGEIDWPQVGIGFGVGIALALALLLAVRSKRQRPLAH
jgi:hypothetical protein